MVILELLIFSLSSGISLFLAISNVSTTILMRITAVLLLFLLVLLNRFIFAQTNKQIGKIVAHINKINAKDLDSYRFHRQVSQATTGIF